MIGSRIERVGYVIFFYEREGHFIRCEVHPRTEGGSELVITPPEGARTVEVLGNSEVTPRLTELRLSFLRAGWWGPFGREF